MAKSRRNAPIETYIDHFCYSTFALEARPETAEMVTLLAPGLEEL